MASIAFWAGDGAPHVESSLTPLGCFSLCGRRKRACIQTRREGCGVPLVKLSVPVTCARGITQGSGDERGGGGFPHTYGAFSANSTNPHIHLPKVKSYRSKRPSLPLGSGFVWHISRTPTSPRERFRLYEILRSDRGNRSPAACAAVPVGRGVRWTSARGPRPDERGKVRWWWQQEWWWKQEQDSNCGRCRYWSRCVLHTCSLPDALQVLTFAQRCLLSVPSRGSAAQAIDCVLVCCSHGRPYWLCYRFTSEYGLHRVRMFSMLRLSQCSKF